MKLSVRLMLAMVLLVAFTTATVALLAYSRIAEIVLPRALDRIDTHARLLASELAASVRNARADAAGFSAAVGIEGIMRASLAGGVDPTNGMTVAQWRDRMAGRFVAEIAAKPAYSQFRLIGVADHGREILRVDRSGPNGAIRVVPESELQRKGDRSYFTRAIRLGPGEVDMSPVELNREHDAIDLPHIPTVRATAPVHAPDGAVFAAVVINLDLRDAFARVRAGAREGGSVYIVNEDGDYLVHPDRAREFGFELGRRTRLQDEFPELADGLALARFAPRVTRARGGATFAVAMASTKLAEGPRVVLVEALPYETLISSTRVVRDAVLIAGLVGLLAAAAAAAIIARSLSRPLVQMTHAVESFAGGGPMTAPVAAGGEIGVLARAFARMAEDARERERLVEREAAERRRIIETSLDAFIQIDDAGATTEWNRQAQTIFGWTREEALGRKLAELIVPAADRVRHEAGLARFVATGQATLIGRRIEIGAVRKDGKTLRVELSITALERDGRFVFNAFVRDLTEKLAAEAQLRQAQKLESIGHLTGGVAHDFNNILTVIIGMSELLKESADNTSDVASAAAVISKAADRGAELVRRLMAFARKQPLDPRKTDVNALIVDTAKLLRPTLGEDVEIESMLAADIVPALVDPSQLAAALLNLAVNARDAMPAGGKLVIETANVELDDAYAQVNADVLVGSYVMIAVSDTGVGIPVAQRELVFEPFFTTKEAGKGTGLGLSMVYGFVKQSGGHVKLYSEEGHGTTVKLYLPRAEPAADRAPDLASVQPAGGSETILVVEDDALVRGHVVTQLQGLGYATVAVGDGPAALAMIDSGAAFDVLFTDVILPGGMNGRQLADAVARRRPGVRVLYTSGYTENAIIHHGRLDPGVALLNKPYRKQDLARKLREVIDAPRPR